MHDQTQSMGALVYTNKLSTIYFQIIFINE
jgi:hypothetical protein